MLYYVAASSERFGDALKRLDRYERVADIAADGAADKMPIRRRCALMSASGTEANLSPWSKPYRVPEEIDILVNATSIGLFPKVETCPNLVMESLRPGPMVADVIPNPPRTALLAKAEQRGCITLDGLGMLVNQGVHWHKAVDRPRSRPTRHEGGAPRDFSKHDWSFPPEPAGIAAEISTVGVDDNRQQLGVRQLQGQLFRRRQAATVGTRERVPAAPRKPGG